MSSSRGQSGGMLCRCQLLQEGIASGGCSCGHPRREHEAGAAAAPSRYRAGPGQPVSRAMSKPRNRAGVPAPSVDEQHVQQPSNVRQEKMRSSAAAPSGLPSSKRQKNAGGRAAPTGVSSPVGASAAGFAVAAAAAAAAAVPHPSVGSRRPRSPALDAAEALDPVHRQVKVGAQHAAAATAAAVRTDSPATPDRNSFGKLEDDTDKDLHARKCEVPSTHRPQVRSWTKLSISAVGTERSVRRRSMAHCMPSVAS